MAATIASLLESDDPEDLGTRLKKLAAPNEISLPVKPMPRFHVTADASEDSSQTDEDNGEEELSSLVAMETWFKNSAAFQKLLDDMRMLPPTAPYPSSVIDPKARAIRS